MRKLRLTEVKDLSKATQQMISGIRTPLQVHLTSKPLLIITTPTSTYLAAKREWVLICSLPLIPFLSLYFLSGKWGS